MTTPTNLRPWQKCPPNPAVELEKDREDKEVRAELAQELTEAIAKGDAEKVANLQASLASRGRLRRLADDERELLESDELQDNGALGEAELAGLRRRVGMRLEMREAMRRGDHRKANELAVALFEMRGK
jgi:hypothetical protein